MVRVHANAGSRTGLGQVAYAALRAFALDPRPGPTAARSASGAAAAARPRPWGVPWASLSPAAPVHLNRETSLTACRPA